MYLVRRNLTAAVFAWLIVASALPAAASTPGSATARPAPAAATGIVGRCAWAVRANRATLNVAYPDTAATYWSMRFTVDPGHRLVIEGRLPHARYASFVTYDTSGRALDVLTDDEIRPVDGARSAPGRRYRVEVRPPGASAGRENGLRSASGRGVIIYRVYVPRRPSDPTGGTGLPHVAIGSRAAHLERVRTCRHAGPGNTVRAVERNGPATDIPAPALPVFVRPKNDATLYPNPDNAYLATILRYRPATLVVVRGRAPTTPPNRARRAADEVPDVRYWSLCSNEYRKPYPVTACSADYQVPLDADGNYTFVVSTGADRPPSATRTRGVTWLDWGRTDVDALLLLRQMLPARAFSGSAARLAPGAQAIPTLGAFAPRAAYCAVATFERGGAAACGL